MAAPPVNGLLAASAGVAGMRAQGVRADLPSMAGLGLAGAVPAGVGLGLLLALALLAYWYRRVL
ncbi:MAG: hypothetical protein KGL54_10785 [Sphingomonadales bacterium]|nr:hypothetical protein [Sphingomonadales bacterium]